jgi:hypothetical protein
MSFRDDKFFEYMGGRKKRRFDRNFSQKINMLFRIAASSFPLSPLKFGVIPIPIEKRIPSSGIGHHLYRKRDLPDLNKFPKVLFPIKM